MIIPTFNSRHFFGSSRAGSAIVELALIVPMVLMLVVGASELARLHNAAIVVANAASSGARYGSQSVNASSDTVGMNRAANNEAGSRGPVAPASLRFCRCPNGSTPASCVTPCAAPAGYPGYTDPEVFVQTSVSKTITFLMKYPGLQPSITLNRTAVFRVQ